MISASSRMASTEKSCHQDLQSSVHLQFCPSATEPDLASELPQAIVSSRRRNQLQSGANRLCHACTAGSLRPFEQVAGYLHCDLARCFHNASHYTEFNTSIEYGRN